MPAAEIRGGEIPSMSVCLLLPRALVGAEVGSSGLCSPGVMGSGPCTASPPRAITARRLSEGFVVALGSQPLLEAGF